MSDSNARDIIPLSEPEISGNEWKYIKDCLDTGWVSSAGEYVNRFEKMVADYVGSNYAVATVNGTSALHVSLMMCGVGPDDEVIVPALTFIAPVNTVRYCGAHPVFMDCEPETLCLDVQKVEDFLVCECELRNDGYTYNRKTNRRVKVVVPVHIFGHPADMDELCRICEKGNIQIIEDATESLGSEYKGKKTGSFGKAGCFSFNGNKIITTGGGGMVVTDDEVISRKIRHLTTQAKKDPLEYDHDEIGYNYRLTNIQAAMGVAQLERIDEFVTKKRKNAALFRGMLSAVEELEFIWEKPWARSNFWLSAIRVPKEHKVSLIEYLLAQGIQVRPVWKPIHTLPMYRNSQTFRIERASEVYGSCINIPSSISIKPEQLEYAVKHIISYFGEA